MNGHVGDIDNRLVGDAHMQHFGFEPAAIALSAWLGRHKTGIVFFLVFGLGIHVPAHKGVDQAFVGTGKTALVNRLAKLVGTAAIVAKIPDPGLSSLDFFNFLAVELKMNKKLLHNLSIAGYFKL